MKRAIAVGFVAILLGAGLLAGAVRGQQAPPSQGSQRQHEHMTHHAPASLAAVPTLPGQDAFGACLLYTSDAADE